MARNTKGSLQGPGGSEDSFNQINTAVLKKGKITRRTVQEVPWDAFSKEPFEKKDSQDESVTRPPEKLHAMLRKWIAERGDEEKEFIVINFRDDLRIPRFPALDVRQTRDSTANQVAIGRAEQLVQQVQERRAGNYEQLRRELDERYKALILETFWLINAVLVEMPLGMVSELAKREDVLFIEPRHSGEEPPDDPNVLNDVDDGRARLVSDPYFNLGLTGGFIGLLDTGVRFSHTLFNSPSNIAFRRDCVNGGANCNTVSAEIRVKAATGLLSLIPA